MPVTLQDVATKLGVSVATVSRALAGYAGVAPATRERVLRTAKEMGYHPNITARRLQKQRTDTIGFIIPTFGPRFSDPYFSEILAGIGNAAAEQDYDVLVSTCSPDTPDEMQAYERFAQGRRVDGMLVVRIRGHDARIAYLLEHKFPFVAFGRSRVGDDFCYLDVDGSAGIREATRHLINLGHRRIAIILPPENLTFAHYRWLGFEEAMVEGGLPIEQTLVEYGELTERSGYEVGSAFLARDDPPSAIVACNDLMALGVISAAQGLGLTVGRDVSVTGFDDVSLAAHSHPPLTTVRQPIYEIGQRICRMLIRLIEGKTLEECHVILKPQLILRESCGVAVQRVLERR
ncbi:MAG: LacI family DNA-binding transcriptional regulator [Chloroflexota bacterium]|nr:LacI family DNA-binding transcriptional regulator [Chloroflexota bacterium]